MAACEQGGSSARPFERLPLVTLYLTERCNSRCVTCDYWRHGRKDATLASVEAMLPELEALDVRVALFSGGEPLLNPEWQSMARLLRSRGIVPWLLTSGLSLTKHASAAAELFDSITVSLDGADAATYMAIRGVPAFDKVCEGIAAVARAGRSAGLRVTVQRTNYREMPELVTLARSLAARQISFLAVDVANPHAFARSAATCPDAALALSDLPLLDVILDDMESRLATEFETGFIAESPAKLRRLRNYFAAVLGQGTFPPVRCNAPEFSAVVDAGGHVSPCFFIDGPAVDAGASFRAALDSPTMLALRGAIAVGARPECGRCVCSMWRDPAKFEALDFPRGHPLS